MTRNGFTMMTSRIAKSKTVAQLSIITFTLIFLSLKGLGWVLSNEIHLFILEYELIYYLTALTVIFTLYTAFSYVLDNQKAIKEIMN
jgi:phosphatidylglycerophosphate synthase